MREGPGEGLAVCDWHLARPSPRSSPRRRVDTTTAARQRRSIDTPTGCAAACARNPAAAIRENAPCRRRSRTKAAQPERPKGDLDPHWSWGRHLPAWGAMGVDFESRVEFDRMRRYRLGPGAAGAGAVRPRRAAAVRREQHPLRLGHQDRRVGARQARPLRAAGARPGADRVGLRLGRRAPPALLALAAEGALQGGPGRPARHRAAELRPHEAPRRGDRRAAARRRRRQACRSASTSSSRR